MIDIAHFYTFKVDNISILKSYLMRLKIKSL